MGLVGLLGIAGPAVHTAFEVGIVRLDELAGAPAAPRVREMPQSVHKPRGAESAIGGAQTAPSGSSKRLILDPSMPALAPRFRLGRECLSGRPLSKPPDSAWSKTFSVEAAGYLLIPALSSRVEERGCGAALPRAQLQRPIEPSRQT